MALASLAVATWLPYTMAVLCTARCQKPPTMLVKQHCFTHTICMCVSAELSWLPRPCPSSIAPAMPVIFSMVWRKQPEVVLLQTLGTGGCESCGRPYPRPPGGRTLIAAAQGALVCDALGSGVVEPADRGLRMGAPQSSSQLDCVTLGIWPPPELIQPSAFISQLSGQRPVLLQGVVMP